MRRAVRVLVVHRDRGGRGRCYAGDTGGILTVNVLTLDHTGVVRNTPDNCVC